MPLTRKGSSLCQRLAARFSSARWAVNFAASLTTGLFVSVLLVACSSSPAEETLSLRNPANAKAAQVGQELFVANCAVCHGLAGEGQPDWRVKKPDGTLPPPPLNGDGHTWHHADGLLYRIVSQGGRIFEEPNYPSFKSGMPAFGEQLRHEEIIAVLTYVKGLWADKTQQGLSISESQELTSEQDPFPPKGD